MKTLRPSQLRAIEQFRAFLATQLDKDADRADTIVEFSVQQTDYGMAWITARTEMTGLPPGNVLRYVAAQHWFVLVGRAGALESAMHPKQFEQFAGRRAFGINFKKR
jgi:hypothetical protein